MIKKEFFEFTNNELYLIERTMDNLCSEHLKGIMQYINTIEHLEGDMKKEGRKFIHNGLMMGRIMFYGVMLLNF